MKVSLLILSGMTKRVKDIQKDLMFHMFFGHVVLINYFKHKRDENYVLSAIIKGKYDIKLAEDDFLRYVTEYASNHEGLFKNHFF